MLASAQATEERLLADAKAREHSLAQMKVNSQRLQAEFANKRDRTEKTEASDGKRCGH